MYGVLQNSATCAWSDRAWTFLFLIRVLQTFDSAEHPVDITLEWAECPEGLCEYGAAASQPVITCVGETKTVSNGWLGVVIFRQTGLH